MMLEFWIELPWWLRLTVALGIAGIGLITFLFVSVRLGCVLTGLGTVLLLVGRRTEAEKKGYRF